MLSANPEAREGTPPLPSNAGAATALFQPARITAPASKKQFFSNTGFPPQKKPEKHAAYRGIFFRPLNDPRKISAERFGADYRATTLFLRRKRNTKYR